MKLSTKTSLIFAFLALLIFTSEAQGQFASWSKFSNIGFIPRYGMTSTLLNGKIYVIGGEGVNWFLNDVQVYDPSADSWNSLVTHGDFPLHFSHTALAIDGKIYVIGGLENNFDFADSIWVLDPSDSSWTVTLPLEGTHFTDRYNLASSVIGDNIYTIGGSAGPLWWVSPVEVFNIKTREWSTPVVTKDSFQIQITPKSFVIDGKIYVVGHPLDTSCHCDVQVYDPQTNIWSVPVTNGMRTPRAYFAANEINGKIYIIGGQDWYQSGKPIATTEFYDPALQTWSLLPVKGILTPRDYLASSSIGTEIYSIGGQASGANYSSATEVLTLDASSVNASSNGKVYFSHRIFPNPATTTLNLVSLETPTKYKIIDVLGREMMTGMTLDHATLTIDISSLLRGIYFVFVERSDVKGVFVSAGKLCAVGSVH